MRAIQLCVFTGLFLLLSNFSAAGITDDYAVIHTQKLLPLIEGCNTLRQQHRECLDNGRSCSAEGLALNIACRALEIQYQQFQEVMIRSCEGSYAQETMGKAICPELLEKQNR